MQKLGKTKRKLPNNLQPHKCHITLLLETLVILNQNWTSKIHNATGTSQQLEHYINT